MNNYQEQIGKKVLETVVNRESHACAMPKNIYFRAECNGIMLWAIPFTRWGIYTRSGRDERYFRYCYSDLEGNPLFGEDTFVYATEVHDGYALIRDSSENQKYVINMTTFEKTPIDTPDASYYGEEPWDKIIPIAKSKIPNPEKKLSPRRLSDCSTIK